MAETPANVPAIAVVGHPNKGKSSLVATLANDDSVAISAEPGTTTRSRRFPMRVDDQVLYELIDTPGFQRARRALAWMRERETTAEQHPAVVRDFLKAHQNSDAFRDEVELLEPIMKGSALLYVVDGSKPYGPEYEAEMEILRWTGRPSLAVINPIENADHVEQWRNALGQYFKVVRVLSAVRAEFKQRLELLRAFGQLDDSWREPMQLAVDILETERTRQRQRSAIVIAEMVAEMMQVTETQKLPPPDQCSVGRLERVKTDLETRYQGRLRQIERRARETVERIYEHHRLERQEADVEVVEPDLFAQETWLAFGLRARDLVGAGAAAGAVTGGATAGWIDVALVGASLGLATGLGAGVGAITGGALGYLTAHRLTEAQVVNLPLGGRLIRCGPAKNTNFPFVALNRARLHHHLVTHRTHAQREALVVTADTPKDLPELTGEQRRSLAKLFAAITKTRRVEQEARLTEELAEAVEPLLTA